MLKHRQYILTAAISLLTCAAIPSVQASDSSQNSDRLIRNIVLVHGLYADGSSWNKVIPILQEKGFNVTAVQNPTTSLGDDVSAVERALELQNGDTLLVGHSYGGMVISQAGSNPKVKGLVYVAARAPEVGEDYAALTKKFPTAPAASGISWTPAGYATLTEEIFLRDFAGDLPREEAKILYAVQQPFGKPITTAKTSVAAWHNVPSWYAVSANDRTINPDLQRYMAKRMAAQTIEIPASHLSLVSQPRVVADFIASAAAGLSQKK